MSVSDWNETNALKETGTYLFRLCLSLSTRNNFLESLLVAFDNGPIVYVFWLLVHYYTENHVPGNLRHCY